MLFSRPLHGLQRVYRLPPALKALGYCHSVRFADEENTFEAKPVLPVKIRTRSFLTLLCPIYLSAL
jgi:hypothetical protein